MATFIRHNKPPKGNEIIVPYLAIDNNIDFMCNGGIAEVELMDGTHCKSVKCTQLKFDSSDDDIKRIYNMGKEDWKMQWMKRVSAMSDEILKIKLEL